MGKKLSFKGKHRILSFLVNSSFSQKAQKSLNCKSEKNFFHSIGKVFRFPVYSTGTVVLLLTFLMTAMLKASEICNVVDIWFVDRGCFELRLGSSSTQIDSCHGCRLSES